MTTISPESTRPNRPDPTRTGAVWVTGTGAFLLLAAAAVFTAVRWDDIPAPAKLGALGLATGGFLLAGRTLKPTLPATAGALFHLGAFLVPIDVAAIGVRQGWDWSSLLLAQGIAATITFGWAAATERSVVLRWAFGAAVVALAGGIGATTDVPAALALVAFAGGALALRHETATLGWSVVAALAPLVTLMEGDLTTGAGTIERLGLAPGQQPLAAAAAAVGGAAMVALIARRRNDVNLALAAAVMAATGVASAWIGTDLGSSETAVALAATFLCVQLAALALRDDPFWQLPLDVIAGVSEMGAALGFLLLGGFAMAAEIVDETAPGLALTALVLAGGWAVADRRRGEVGLALASTVVGGCTVMGVAFATQDPLALAATCAGVAVAAVVAGRRDGIGVAVVAATAAVGFAWDAPVVAAVAGLVGGLTIAEAAVRQSRRPTDEPRLARAVEETAWIVSLLALAPPVLAVWCVASSTGQVAATLVGGAAVLWALAAWTDRGVTSGDLPLGTFLRAGVVGVIAGTGDLPPEHIGLVALAVAALSVLDAVRLGKPVTALGASLAVPVAIGAFVHASGLSAPSTGVALTVAAVVVGGLGSMLGRQWAVPVGAAVGVALTGGLFLASGDAAAFADALMITGGVGMALSIGLDRVHELFLSGAVTTMGLWIRLADHHVVATEPYVLPVAGLLLLAGLRSRGRDTSSWIAYGPAVALLGGTALLERMDGGAGWHAVLAGAVGVVAVAVGGDRKLAAPLLLGTAILVVLTGYETLDITAGLPTWIWLALGGTSLLTAGVVMERHDVGPLETGRRLVDVVADRFT